MSNAIFPVLPGLAWDSSKTPTFSGKVLRAVSGKELRAAYWSYPIYSFGLSYSLLRDNSANNELQILAGFFLARQGSFDNFLYTDPSDNSVTGQNFGTGTGAQATFQLVRAYGGFSEPVMNTNGAPSIYVAGVLQTVTTNYTISSLGGVTFVVAPANGAALTWTGSYYYRVRFVQDMAQFVQFMSRFWELKKIELVGSLGNKI